MGISTLLHGLSTKDPRPWAAKIKGELSEAELIRYRYQTGPNFGALFVQEKWIDNSLFNLENDQGGSELAALKSWGNDPNLDELQKKWEAHWSQFITLEDWQLLKNQNVTGIRLPIGFYSLGSPELMKDTPFADYAKVYENSWRFIVEIISKARQNNIGVLLDVHALPGGANGDEHSGTNTGKAELWSTAKNRDSAIQTYLEIVKLLDKESDEVKHNVIGLQLVNEAPYGESKRDGFYLDALSKIRESEFKIGKTLTLVVSDSWDCEGCVSTIKEWNDKVGDTGFVADTHVYRTFSDEDKSKSAEQHISEISSAVSPAQVDIFVGEWSCCLSEETWGQSQGDRGQLEAQFGEQQLNNYKQLAGNFFWTFKFGQGSGGSWDWRVMQERGVKLGPITLNEGNLDESLQNALNAHRNYWEQQNKDIEWEFNRFEDGFRLGWQDVEQFANYHGSRAGRLNGLKSARLAGHIEEKGDSDKVFNFVHGYEQGVNARQSA